MTEVPVYIMHTAGHGYVAQDLCAGLTLATDPDLDTCAADAFRIAPTCNVIVVLDGAGSTTRTIHRNLAPASAPRDES